MKITDRDKYEKALKETYGDNWKQVDKWTKLYFQTGSRKALIELTKLLGNHGYPAVVKNILLEDITKNLYEEGGLYNGKTTGK